MTDIPVINVPRPFGLFIVAGVMGCALCEDPTTYRGRVAIFQTEPPDPGFYKRAKSALMAVAGGSAARAAINRRLMACDWGLALTHGPVGQANLVDVADLQSPGCALRFTHHLNQGYAKPPHRYAWMLNDPKPVGGGNQIIQAGAGNPSTATAPGPACNTLF